MSEFVAGKKRWLISQAELEAWLEGIAKVRTLIAPRYVSGIMLYRPLNQSAEIAWDGLMSNFTHTGRPVLSIKEVFFPPTEQLFTIQKTGQEIHLEEVFPDWEAVVFGVRACEARAVKLLDSLFLDTDPVDSFYARRRGNTTLIGLACTEPGPTCFCTSVGCAPDKAQDVDIMLYKTDEGYMAEEVTEKGHFIKTASVWRETFASPPRSTYGVPFTVPEKREWAEHFNDEYWQKISERCLSCRACAYVCPTCHCFAVRDEMTGPGEFERIRCWDSCAGENYRRLAGGNQARPEKSERLRNRLFCKFYYFSEQTGLGETSACTGCGRCIDVCPVGVDITEVLRELERPA